MLLVEKLGYRVDSRTIKRGSQVSNMIASLWRAQTSAYLAYHLSWLLFGFYPCENLELVFISIPSSSSSQMDFINILLHFLCWRFYRFVFSKRGQTLVLWFPPHMMDYDVYMLWSCRACGYLRNKTKIIKNGDRMKNLLGSWYWRIYRLFFIQRFCLSTFGFILPCLTMMFLCILL